MRSTCAIFSNSVFFPALIPLFAIRGLWITYFTQPPETVSGYKHLRGFVMFVWVLMLVNQSFLIRTKRRQVRQKVRTCPQAILIDGGTVRHFGATEEVLNHYHRESGNEKE